MSRCPPHRDIAGRQVKRSRAAIHALLGSCTLGPVPARGVVGDSQGLGALSIATSNMWHTIYLFVDFRCVTPYKEKASMFS
jgi:hypothetical protein